MKIISKPIFSENGILSLFLPRFPVSYIISIVIALFFGVSFMSYYQDISSHKLVIYGIIDSVNPNDHYTLNYHYNFNHKFYQDYGSIRDAYDRNGLISDPKKGQTLRISISRIFPQRSCLGDIRTKENSSFFDSFSIFSLIFLSVSRIFEYIFRYILYISKNDPSPIPPPAN